MTNLGENIYLWRLSKGLSQESLAVRAGIPRPNLSAIEKGRQNITIATLRALSFALGINPGLLVDGIAPLELNKSSSWPRKLLENTVQASLDAAFYGFGYIEGQTLPCRPAGIALPAYKLNPKDKAISNLLSKITKNRINAQKRIYKNIIKPRKAYINSWLMLKSGIGKEIVSNLLSRQDKLLNLKISE